MSIKTFIQYAFKREAAQAPIPQYLARHKAKSILDEIAQRQASRTANDMRAWREAKRQSGNPDFPKRVLLSDLVSDMMDDIHLASQTDIRRDHSLAKSFVIKMKEGKEDEETTKRLVESIAFGKLLTHLLETPLYGHTLLEITPAVGDLFALTLIPRRHIVAAPGILLREVTDTTGIHYREDHRYGTSLLEFGDSGDSGIIFKNIPDTIFRRHAKVAWSEFLEIYGIPPRVLKMDTDDSEGMERAKIMMERMGRAAFAIVDSTEELQFATGIAANSDMFTKLITACEQSIAINICGAVIGADTEHGNRSKEEVSIRLLEAKTAKDRKLVERWMNSTVLPALERLGHIPAGRSFEYVAEEDEEALWSKTVQIMPYYDVDPAWIKQKFGIEVDEKKQAPGSLAATSEDSFFG